MSEPYSFAHLIGLATRAASPKKKTAAKGSRAASPVEEDPTDQQYADGDGPDEDAEDDDEADPKAKKAKSARADDGDDDGADDADAEDDDETEPKTKKAKGARAESDDDSDGADAEDEDDAPKAVRADRKRCAAIIAYGVANGCIEQAGTLAFNTNMGKSAAITVLQAGASRGGKNAQGSLGRRMASVSVPNAGVEGSAQLPKGVSAVAAGIIKAGQ